MLRSSYQNYYVNVENAFSQYQFSGIEDYQLEAPVTSSLPFYIAEPRLRLFFAIPAAAAKPELARVLFVFAKLFLVKPSVSRVSATMYHVHATFDAYRFSRVISLLLRLKRLNNSKFLKFSHSSDRAIFLTLDEPLTFFPLVHPNFDYHDWKYPFTFELVLSKISSLAALHNFNTFFSSLL